MSSPPGTQPSLLRLRPLRLEDEPAALAAHVALGPENFAFLLDYEEGEPFGDYLERQEAERRGEDLAGDRVPGTLLAATAGGRLVGRIHVRFELNEWLAQFGGHIGYAVVPDQRRRGYASEMLRQGLIIARAAGVDRVLVICDDINVASARTIESCGGELETVVDVQGGRLRRYWID